MGMKMMTNLQQTQKNTFWLMILFFPACGKNTTSQASEESVQLKNPGRMTRIKFFFEKPGITALYHLPYSCRVSLLLYLS